MALPALQLSTRWSFAFFNEMGLPPASIWMMPAQASAPMASPFLDRCPRSDQILGPWELTTHHYHMGDVSEHSFSTSKISFAKRGQEGETFDAVLPAEGATAGTDAIDRTTSSTNDESSQLTLNQDVEGRFRISHADIVQLETQYR